MVSKYFQLDPCEFENFVSVDVGLHTAVAQFINSKLVFADVAHCPKEIKEKSPRIKRLRGAFVELLEQCRPFNAIFIEGIQVYSSSSTSQAAAYRGDTVFTAELVGVFYAEALRFCDKVHIVLPRQWRGNMSNEVVENRVCRALGRKFPEHVGDAVGIGLSVLGKL